MTRENDRQPSCLKTYKEDRVSAYVQAGYTLVPCGAKHRLKAPLRRDWQETKYSPNISAIDLPVVYGVVLQDDDLVIDYDAYKESDDRKQLQELFKSLALPKAETFIVESGRGNSFHLYFKKPPGLHIRTHIEGYPALEFFSRGHYVIGAGSLHPETQKPYTVTRGDITQVMQAPQALLDLLHWEPDETDRHIVVDDLSTRTRYIQFLMSAAPAIEGQQGDNTTYKTALKGRDYGLPEDTTFELLLDYYNPRCVPEWSGDELRDKVAHAYAYAKGSQGCEHPSAAFADEPIEVQPEPQPKGKPEALNEISWTDIRWAMDGKKIAPNLSNGLNYFLLEDSFDHKTPNPLRDMLKYNAFTQQVEFSKRAPWHKPHHTLQSWSDIDDVMLKLYLSKYWHFDGSTALAGEIAMAAAQLNDYHPVLDYLDSVMWDGKPRLDRWLITYAGAPDTPYVREVGKNTIIALVARVRQPGCQHDHMLILEGKQGIGKTTLVRILGGPWFGDVKIDTHSRDTVAGMMGKWVVEMSELEVFRRADVAALKRFLTLTADTVRLAYRRNVQNITRQSAFIGTINPHEDEGYFRDATGNRRFWPVAVRKIDRDALQRDRDQLFAEACVRYAQGEAWYIVDSALQEAAEYEQWQRMATDTWQDIIADWLARNADTLPDELSIGDIAFGALAIPANRLGHFEKSRIGAAMRKAGYWYVLVRRGGARLRVWQKVPELLQGL